MTYRGVTTSRPHTPKPNQKNELAATKRGNYIHAALAEMSANNFQTIPAWIDRTTEAYVSIRRAQAWLLDHRAETIMAEREVTYLADNNTRVIGRIDLLAYITGDDGEKEIALIDFKTEDRRSYETDAKAQLQAWSYQLLEYIRGIPDRYKPSSAVIIHLPRQSIAKIKKAKVTVCGTDDKSKELKSGRN